MFYICFISSYWKCGKMDNESDITQGSNRVGRQFSIKKNFELNSERLKSLLEGLRKVEAAAGNYLGRNKVLDDMCDESDVTQGVESSSLDLIAEEVGKKKKQKYVRRIKMIENLEKDLRDNADFQIHQVEVLFNLVIKTHISIHCDKEIRFLSSKSFECVKNILGRFIFSGKIPSSYMRKMFEIIHDTNYWQLKEDCLHLIGYICEKYVTRSKCLLYIMEYMLADYEYLSEEAYVLKVLLLNVKREDVESVSRLLVERCCQLLAECDPRKSQAKADLEGCLASLVPFNKEKILSSIALQTIRVSIGLYRSDIADLLHNLCKDIEISDLSSLVSPLMVMIDDRDADVVIRGYQIFTLLLSPSIAYVYQINSNNILQVKNIKYESVGYCSSSTLEEIKIGIKQIILSMLISYIRHAIYPKTLEAILTFNCTLIIEVRDLALLSRITALLMNLQEASLSILPIKSMRQSFMQWAVTHLFLLIADVYSINNLNEYILDILEQRMELAPFLISPISPASIDFIPKSCLVETQQINRIIKNWIELTDPTRLLNELSPASSLSRISAWEEIDIEL